MIIIPARKIFALVIIVMSSVGCSTQISTIPELEAIVAEKSSQTTREKPLEGYVDLEFVVNEHGRVESPVVLQSSTASFEPAAIRAVQKFEYDPRMVDGQPVSVPGVTTRISFKLEDEPREIEKD